LNQNFLFAKVEERITKLISLASCGNFSSLNADIVNLGKKEVVKTFDTS
jgi:hypothetical protein